MDTSYAGNVVHPTGGSGVFGAGRAGVDLQQGLISLGYAQRFGNLSLGVAPVVAVQVFSAYGLGSLAAYSSSAANLSDRSPAWSVGAGLRLGGLYKVNEQFNIAVTGVTPIWTTSFQNYSGLFANGGNFDLPAEIGAGIAYKILPTLAALVDYKHIFYSSVKSVGDALAPIGYASLGTANGPGFGWRDIDVIAVGLEWSYSDRLTLRAGYAHNTQPITGKSVLFNILAPAVVTDRVSGGFGYRIDGHSSVDFAVTYAPKTGVTGQEYLPPPYGGVYNPASSINISMSQLEVTLGYTYHFDAPKAAVAAKY
jgi:long-chain fatty acid transport protein